MRFVLPLPIDRVEAEIQLFLKKFDPMFPRVLLPYERKRVNKDDEMPSLGVPFGILFKRVLVNNWIEYQLDHSFFGNLGSYILKPTGDGEIEVEDVQGVMPTLDEALRHANQGFGGKIEFRHIDLPVEMIMSILYNYPANELMRRREHIRQDILEEIKKLLLKQVTEPWKLIPGLSPDERERYRKVWVEREKGFPWEAVAEKAEIARNTAKKYYRSMKKIQEK